MQDHVAELRARSVEHHALVVGRLAVWADSLEMLEEADPSVLPREVRDYYEAVTGVLRGDRTTEALAAQLAALSAGLPPRSRVARLYHQLAAEALGRAGDAERTLATIESAIDAGLHDAEWMARCPALDLVRDAPRFAELRDVVRQRATPIRDAYLRR